ncbi:hypothetical protein AB0G04_08075 [Actinoplanes sp. NPDC023801]|uniref:hypothetical protein n=1 Tax=Actinoplanes sp. NPDC023801 TaxID=3154595 RepID=UPI0033D04587
MSEGNARFRMVSLRSESGVPPWLAARLLDPGVPEDFIDGLYAVLDTAQFEEGPDLGRVLFGSAAWGGKFIIDLDSLKISVVNDLGSVSPANSSLDQFSECVRVVSELCWPDWSMVEDFDYCDVIADHIRERVLAIDDVVFSSSAESFWETFYYDVRTGVYLE